MVCITLTFSRSDFILKKLSRQLREVASTDKLVASMGVSGGVSGYAHSVLVPELAVCLVREDFDVGTEEAKKIVSESADLGDLLNEEQEERIPRALASPPPTYGMDRASAHPQNH